jgi:hypothetical protein
MEVLSKVSLHPYGAREVIVALLGRFVLKKRHGHGWDAQAVGDYGEVIMLVLEDWRLSLASSSCWRQNVADLWRLLSETIWCDDKIEILAPHDISVFLDEHSSISLGIDKLGIEVSLATTARHQEVA